MTRHGLVAIMALELFTNGTAFVGQFGHYSRAEHSRDPRNPPSTTVWSTVNSDTVTSSPDAARQNEGGNLVGVLLPDSRPSIHPWAVQAIAEALPAVAKAMKDNEEPFEVMGRIGSVTQRVVQQADLKNQEESQVLGGRIVAILTRLEVLEDQLQAHAEKLSSDGYSNQQIQEYLGFPALELMAKPGELGKIKQRAETLLAWFLETIEGPGLRANNVVVPCMDVDFLDHDRYQAITAGLKDHAKAMEELQEKLDDISRSDKVQEETTARKSLHPMTIDILAEVLRLRAQNDTNAPMRFINDSIEGWEILAQATKLAETIVQPALKQGELDPEQASLIGGRIVAIVMRLEDLEWELLHRCKQASWITDETRWDSFGVLRDESCTRTLDERILEDAEFAIKRAERLLALFLLNLEGPGVRAAGDKLLDGSMVDFLEDDHYQIMMPRKNKP